MQNQKKHTRASNLFIVAAWAVAIALGYALYVELAMWSFVNGSK